MYPRQRHKLVDTVRTDALQQQQLPSQCALKLRFFIGQLPSSSSTRHNTCDVYHSSTWVVVAEPVAFLPWRALAVSILSCFRRVLALQPV